MVILGVASGTVPGTVRQVVPKASCKAVLTGTSGPNSAVISRRSWTGIRKATHMTLRSGVGKAVCGDVAEAIRKRSCEAIRKGTCVVTCGAIRMASCGVDSGRTNEGGVQ